MGEAQVKTAEASEQYRQARDTEDAAQRALWTARDQLLAEAEQVHLPGSPAVSAGEARRADDLPGPRRVADRPQA